MNLKTQGFILLDVDVVALNNAGISKANSNDNNVETKKIYKDGRSYTYVSGQAWRYWWRETLKNSFAWQLSPITRDSKIAFTEANPFVYPDDDLFGYMRAPKKEKKKNKKGADADIKVEGENKDTLTRISPLKNSVFVSVASTSPVTHLSSMARQEGDSVLYGKEEYSAIMKGMFSLDLFQVGTFSSYNKTGFKNLTEKAMDEAIKKGFNIVEDPFVRDTNGVSKRMIQLPRNIRIQRIVDTIAALKTISGGAMQTNNMADVTPKFIVLATMNSGNHPFSHIVKSDGVRAEKALLNIEGLREVINDYRDQFQGTIFIGKRSGFMDEYDAELKALEIDYSNVRVLTVNQAIDQYCEQVTTQIP